MPPGVADLRNSIDALGNDPRQETAESPRLQIRYLEESSQEIKCSRHFEKSKKSQAWSDAWSWSEQSFVTLPFRNEPRPFLSPAIHTLFDTRLMAQLPHPAHQSVFVLSDEVRAKKGQYRFERRLGVRK